MEHIMSLFRLYVRPSKLIAVLMEDSKYKLAIFSIILLSGLVLWYFRLLLLFEHDISDFNSSFFWFVDLRHSYYPAAQAIVVGDDIYTHYAYPPLSILLFIPLAYLSLGQAYTLWTVLNVLMLVATIVIISRILHHYGARVSKTELSLIFVATFLFYPVSITITLGQINILVLFLIALFYYYLFIHRKKTIASIFLSLATVIKVWPFILVVLSFITQKTKGLFVRYCLVFGFLCIISLVLFGISMHIDFLNYLVAHQTMHMPMPEEVFSPKDAWVPDVSIFTTVSKLLSISGVGNLYFPQILLGLKIILILTALYHLYKQRRGDKYSSHPDGDILPFTFVIILLLVVSNNSWHHYGSFLVLSSVLLVFAVKLDMVEKALFMGFIALFSAQQYVVQLANILGGAIKSVVYVANPATYAYLLFLFLIYYMMGRRKRIEYGGTRGKR